MSRRQLQPTDPNHRVVVGWDKPSDTFFGQVFAVEGDDNDEPLAHWSEIPSATALVDLVRPYAQVPDTLVQDLEADRDNDVMTIVELKL